MSEEARLPFRAERSNDLPPRWDGHAVEWRPWGAMPAPFICPTPPDDSEERCPACGSTESRDMALGCVYEDTGSYEASR